MRSSYKPIGRFIRLVKTRNAGLEVTELRGIRINKEFMPSVANVIGTDLENYKVVRKNQFAYNPMHVGRDGILPIAQLDSEEPVIVSPAYVVFEIGNPDELLPEYLMMWCRRPEFDRQAWFTTDSSVRGGFDWKDFCEMEMPVPSPEKQREIVAEYETVVKRIALNEKLGRKLEETAQAIYKHWFVDFEFPMSAEDARKLSKPELEGKPYQSSGGEMVFDEVLKTKIPLEWETLSLGELGMIRGGKRLPLGLELQREKTAHPYIRVSDMGSMKFSNLTQNFQFLSSETQKLISRYVVSPNDVIISIVGTIGIVKVVDESLNGANLTENCARIYGMQKIKPSYLFHYLSSEAGRQEIELRTVGGVQGKLPLYNISGLMLTVPPSCLVAKFEEMIRKVDRNLKQSIKGANLLSLLRDMILTRVVLAE